MSDERLVRQVPFRVTDSEAEWINEQVAASGLSKNAWLREQLGLPVPGTPGFKPGASNPRSREARVRQLTAQGMTSAAARRQVEQDSRQEQETRQDAPGRGIAGA